MGVIRAPEPLGQHHDTQSFDCGDPGLNDWLRKRARKAEHAGSARTYVVCTSDNRVIGYCSLAAGAINQENVPGRVKRNMPDPVPVILLGRLAVDNNFKGHGIGSGLLKDALQRAVSAAGTIGARAVLVHALDESARTFYQKHGLYESPTSELTLMVTMAEIERTLEK